MVTGALSNGDNVCHDLCSELGFSAAEHPPSRGNDRAVRRNVYCLNAFISLFRADRQWVRDLVGDRDFIEVYCSCPLDICEQRDTKGIYRRARAGEVKEFTGISSPYEEPENPDLVLSTGERSIEECVQRMLTLLEKRGVIIKS